MVASWIDLGTEDMVENDLSARIKYYQNKKEQ